MSKKQKVSAKTRPPLKWAGGKFRIVDEICRLLPKGKRLIEPFVGSGAVFLNTDFEQYVISDINYDLILFYRILKKEQKKFISNAKRLFTSRNNNAESYYRLRKEFNTTTNPLRKATLFLYLNKHGYNGLCRYNAAGEMNVPFGRYKKPYFQERELLAFIEKAERVSIKHEDFAKAMRSAHIGDVIYCDPPYVPLSDTSNFTTYSAGGFSRSDQQRLADIAEETAKRGIPVLISNHYTSDTSRMYRAAKAAKLESLNVRRLISCNSSKRENAREVLALFCPNS